MRFPFVLSENNDIPRELTFLFAYVENPAVRQLIGVFDRMCRHEYLSVVQVKETTKSAKIFHNVTNEIQTIPNEIGQEIRKLMTITIGIQNLQKLATVHYLLIFTL